MLKLLSAALMLASVSISVHAEENFGDWSVKNAGSKCVAYTKTLPNLTEQATDDRKNAVLTIMNMPSEGVENSVAFMYGKKDNASVTASAMIDNTVFELLTFNGAAFAKSGDPEGQLIAAMKRGATVDVTWRGQNGYQETDRYSLKGFSAAKNKIDQDCR